VTRPIPPEAIVFGDDDPDEVLGRARSALVDTFVLVDDTGVPTGVIRAADILAAAGRPPRQRRGDGGSA